jgi:hypothetical protein
MYAETSRRPPPSRPFLNLLSSLVHLPLRCLVRALTGPFTVVAAFFNTLDQRCQPANYHHCHAYHSPVTARSISGGSLWFRSSIQSELWRAKAYVAPGRRACAGRALTQASSIGPSEQRQVQPYSHAVGITAHLDGTCCVSGTQTTPSAALPHSDGEGGFGEGRCKPMPSIKLSASTARMMPSIPARGFRPRHGRATATGEPCSTWRPTLVLSRSRRGPRLPDHDTLRSATSRQVPCFPPSGHTGIGHAAGVVRHCGNRFAGSGCGVCAAWLGA